MLPTKYITSSQDEFTINTIAYKAFLEENDLTRIITHLLGTIDYTDHTSIQRASKHIQKHITDGLLPKELVAEIFRSYALLSGVLHDEKVIMTLAGTESITQKVKGEATLLVTLKELWAACFSPESLLEHQTNKQALLDLGFAITVEKVDKKVKFDQSSPAAPAPIASKIPSSPMFQTATKIYANASQPDLADILAKCQVDGIGLLRADAIMATPGTHPKYVLRSGKQQEYIEELAQRIAHFARPFSPRPVVYQTSDLTTEDYRQLQGGEVFELQEANPMLGYRGTHRSLHDPEVFALELEAIKHARDNLGLKNIWLMLPIVRTVEELQAIKKRITEAGLYRSLNFKLWMTIEVPSNVLLLDTFIEAGIDGVSIDIADLTMFLLGVDTSNTEIAKEFTQENEAVLWAVEKVIKTAHKYHITSSLHTKDTLSSKLLEHIIHGGITSVSVDPSDLETTREQIASIERRLLSEDRK